MSDAADSTRADSGAARVVREVVGDRHFLVAAVLLAILAGGWDVLTRWMDLATQKAPVPWPAPVEVDEDFRLTSLPDRIGPYEFVKEDGVLPLGKPKPEPDGEPDGRIVPRPDEMELLDIGTYTDKRNLPRRRSNWYTMRLYRDTRLPERHPLRYWRLEIYYYTGGVDLVPHVPEICAVAGGATHVGTDVLPIPLADVHQAWGAEPVPLRRATFHRPAALGIPEARFAQYYIFSMNGRPEGGREVVRLKLASPFIRHAYFAKIQFAPQPVYSYTDVRAADPAAQEFARRILPTVLKFLPMPGELAEPDAAAAESSTGSGNDG